MTRRDDPSPWNGSPVPGWHLSPCIVSPVPASFSRSKGAGKAKENWERRSRRMSRRSADLPRGVRDLHGWIANRHRHRHRHRRIGHLRNGTPGHGCPRSRRFDDLISPPKKRHGRLESFPEHACAPFNGCPKSCQIGSRKRWTDHQVA